ncbi:effector-associated constant component EACC1 [Streptomyces sp. BRA346]|uniref:effector-associated constant component EACC1 n=1 Tax=Streptomyces sp. BRA346 TaxID=2878199 RepID=UPI0040639365
MPKPETLPELRFEASAADVGDFDALASLHQWMAQDIGANNRISLHKSEARPSRGEMSGGFETITAITDQLISLANLALAYLTWRIASRATPDGTTSLQVRIEVNGANIEIASMTDDQLRELVERLNRGDFNNDFRTPRPE